MTMKNANADEIEPCLSKKPNIDGEDDDRNQQVSSMFPVSYNGIRAEDNDANDDEDDVEDNVWNKKFQPQTLDELPRPFQDSVCFRGSPLLSLFLILLATTLIGTSYFMGQRSARIVVGKDQESNPPKEVQDDLISVRYNPIASQQGNDPFHLVAPSWYGGIFVEPWHPSLTTDLLHHRSDNGDVPLNVAPNNVGYIKNPNIYNDTLVFCSEGDVYLTTISNTRRFDTATLPFLDAMRLTSTIGNADTPKINPSYPYLLAFTATYTGHREAYLLDLRPDHRSRPSMRLTYTDSEYGLRSIVGWEDEGATLVVSSFNMEVALPDVRLYKIGILQHRSDGQGRRTASSGSQQGFSPRQLAPIVTVASINPVPLSQAIDSVVDESSGCRFFTRYTQSSNTIRYVGGTVPRLWAYCHDEDLAVPLTQDYNGTSQSPSIYSLQGPQKFLFFLSDRVHNKNDVKDGTNWTASTMDIWAMSLPKKEEIYQSASEIPTIPTPFRITSVSCDFNGMSLQEYAIDAVTGNVVLRIGADLHFMSRQDIQRQIKVANLVSPKSGSRAMYDSREKEGGRQEKEKNKRGGENHKAENPNSMKESMKKPPVLPIAVYSDFNNLHERIHALTNPSDVKTLDVYGTSYGTISTLFVARGQLFVNPVIENTANMKDYDGGGMNMPPRRYRIAPGSVTGGMIRILGAWHIPNSPVKKGGKISQVALVLGTDPKSPTAEMAFYLLETSAEAVVQFADIKDLPTPILGGHVNGGSVADGGLGSINVASVSVSPCGRRVAWTDTDKRVVVLSIDSVNKFEPDALELLVLPNENERGEPMKEVSSLIFSPAGRYLAVEHAARNQFQIISIIDMGDPGVVNKLSVGRAVQATNDRFNSMNPVWGRLPVDQTRNKLYKLSAKYSAATTLFFLTDRDVVSAGASNPWGSRAPNPSFANRLVVFALPLTSIDAKLKEDPFGGTFVGGGAAELVPDHLNPLITSTESSMGENTYISNVTVNSNDDPDEMEQFYTPDANIFFGDGSDSLMFAHRSYLMSYIPPSNYIKLYQLQDDPSLILVEEGTTPVVVFCDMAKFPSDSIEIVRKEFAGFTLKDLGTSSDMAYMHFTYSNKTKVVPNTLSGVSSLFDSDALSRNIVDTSKWAVNIWPKLEYQQMYSDAWRMLRDYYYDVGMGNVDWPIVHARYLPLVARCGKREELDDVLKQMSSELSALHVFVYGGEYNNPMHGDVLMENLNEIASLGAVLQRSVDWGGYVVKEIPLTDADFNQIDGEAIYSPLSGKTLEKVGQRGLIEGDVIVRVNGESVINVPDIHMLLRGMAGRSVRLDVLRVKSLSSFSQTNQRKNLNEADILLLTPEPMIVVPISQSAAANLRYSAWEWKTRKLAKSMAKRAGFEVGYMHLQAMDSKGEDAFVRGLYPDYDKEGLIIDVRHNVGGNIDSWLLSSLQRKAWMYFQGRATNITNGGLGWDDQFAFRGHIVVLVDEKTSSDGEGFSRGVSELGLGLVVGTRTWGGGIWLSSDNHLVDGGIATAPEIGTYNANFGWGLGIEQIGVEPDIVVDNNPKESFEGRDRQLERAVKALKDLLESEPITLPDNPGPHRDVSLSKSVQNCAVD